jgi:hypothetical protein
MSVADAPRHIVGELTVIGVKVLQLIVAVPIKLRGKAVVCELKLERQIKKRCPHVTFSSA